MLPIKANLKRRQRRPNAAERRADILADELTRLLWRLTRGSKVEVKAVALKCYGLYASAHFGYADPAGAVAGLDSADVYKAAGDFCLAYLGGHQAPWTHEEIAEFFDKQGVL